MSFQIQLQTDSILHVSFLYNQKDFIFQVNGEEFETTKVFADLLSPKISKYHQTDPTLSYYTINTSNKGNFQHILDLLGFDFKEIDDTEIPFISEIIENLCIQNININMINTPKINLENVFKFIKNHEKAKFFYSSNLLTETDFLSSHFYKLNEEQIQHITELEYTTINSILSNSKLKLKSEDQLLNFIQILTSKDAKFSQLYEHVCFSNISCKMMKSFVESFDYEEMTRETWISLSKRLIKEIQNSNEQTNEERYKCQKFYKNGENLNGIFKYLQTNSDIKQEVGVTFSAHQSGDEYLLLDIEKSGNEFYTKNETNSWICFEFKKRQIIPTGYTIRSFSNNQNTYHLKNWVIECSNDGKKWIEIDKHNDCSFLNGKNFVHTFDIDENKNIKRIKYIRIRQVGPNWSNDNYLEFSSIEFYGKMY